jgi:hypothetical protein
LQPSRRWTLPAVGRTAVRPYRFAVVVVADRHFRDSFRRFFRCALHRGWCRDARLCVLVQDRTNAWPDDGGSDSMGFTGARGNQPGDGSNWLQDARPCVPTGWRLSLLPTDISVIYPPVFPLRALAWVVVGTHGRASLFRIRPIHGRMMVCQIRWVSPGRDAL